jgi:hypothetical protein
MSMGPGGHLSDGFPGIHHAIHQHLLSFNVLAESAGASPSIHAGSQMCWHTEIRLSARLGLDTAATSRHRAVDRSEMGFTVSMFAARTSTTTRVLGLSRKHGFGRWSRVPAVRRVRAFVIAILTTLNIRKVS